MTDIVNIVESVCQDPGRPALAEQETYSQNTLVRWKMRPSNTVAEGANSRRASYSITFICRLHMLQHKSKTPIETF